MKSKGWLYMIAKYSATDFDKGISDIERKEKRHFDEKDYEEIRKTVNDKIKYEQEDWNEI